MIALAKAVPGCDSSLLGPVVFELMPLEEAPLILQSYCRGSSETHWHVYDQLPSDSPSVLPLLAFLSFLPFACSFGLVPEVL